MTLLIGIDVGTTNIKAVLYDPARGAVLATASRPMITHQLGAGWSEFHPDEVWTSVAEVVREVSAATARGGVAGVAVASMGEAGLPLDDRQQPLYPIIAWYDPRTEGLDRWWTEHYDPRRLYEITGVALRHTYGLNKLLWLREHRRAVYQELRQWLSVEDFVLWKLTGQYVTDYSVASRTMAFDQRAKTWSAEVLAHVDVPLDIWPTALPSGSAVGPLTPEAAAETGLETTTLAVTGGHDHLCGALAAGLLTPGSILDSTGTAELVFGLSQEYRPSDRLRAAGLSCYHYVAPDRYVVQGGFIAAGGGLAWLVRLLSNTAGIDQGDEAIANGDYETLFAEAADVPPGSRGLLWLPHFLGSGSPEFDPDSRGALLGLTIARTRGELVRSLLEALCYWLRQNLELLEEELDKEVREIIAIGGATKAPLWTQLKSNITGRPVRVPALSQATATGTALLAGIGAGIFTDEVIAVDSLTIPLKSYLPDLANTEQYAKLYYDLYLPLYPLLKEICHKLAEMP
jgi:xylulokinase